ncbi:MAG: NAD-dependent succinate-semialdehyde dehydrogenase [Cyanophyceae cyanobacterium]
MGIASINPATGDVTQRFDPMDSSAVEHCIERSHQAFLSYRTTSFEGRSRWLRQLATLLDKDCDNLATIATLEMGKTRKAAIAEIRKCALVCRHYADHGAQYLADEAIATDASYSGICYQPLGIILAVMPWNYPFWQVLRFAAPTLMAGNVGLLKHSSNVPQVALKVEALIRAAGFPPDVFQTLLIRPDQVETIVKDDRIKGATLTGSEAAGASLASHCGTVIKPTVLELGGSDPCIVMPSADLEAAVNTVVTGRTMNNGQSCIAIKRIILHGEIADEFLRQFIQCFKDLVVGDPMDDATDVGPLSTPAMADELEGQVQALVDSGAKVLMGGDRQGLLKTLPTPLQKGNFFPPTILTDIPPCPTRYEELFGPVAMVFRVGDLDEAIAIANETPFGLGGSAWTNDDGEAERAIKEIEAGAVFINGLVSSDPCLPFGGVGLSGYGRELSAQGIRAFVNTKTVWRR